VQVQPGENLQQLAARVVPDAPVTRVAERIKELNDLDSATLDAGETLVVPAR
ncbi:MAG TPA: LysM peptidoglycan-binding domain-containing protein, partial [Mycobacterium sp.]|nr:LysM peptidoglycan-binding domain-containing protein [Mycobacterium sp.]